jgi:hypothetical protein
MPRTQCGDIVAFDDEVSPENLTPMTGTTLPHTALSDQNEDAFPWSDTIAISGALAAE